MHNIEATENRENYRQTEERLKSRVGFYWHVVNYIIVNGILLVIYLFTCLAGGRFYYPWFLWPLAIWGVALFIHFLNVFIFSGRRLAATRQVMIESEMRRRGFCPASFDFQEQSGNHN